MTSIRSYCDGMRVDDIMSRTVITLGPDDVVRSARTLFRERNIHHLVVASNEQAIGVVSYRELSGRTDDTPLREVMNRDFVTAAPSTTLRDAAAMMLRHAAGCLPIIDRGIVGILTTTDLLRNLGRPQRERVSA